MSSNNRLKEPACEKLLIILSTIYFKCPSLFNIKCTVIKNFYFESDSDNIDKYKPISINNGELSGYQKIIEIETFRQTKWEFKITRFQGPWSLTHENH